ncbi:hypothetical protein MN032_11065 [Agromyces atrinae]|uniref:hypothetical protein n=1 Tax=Agromyces atrinae TaxID=592376 RepID=UPI001F55CA3D|nr:hypothetical protein [Agromyces atrinae]MCI2958238.1 hypothetical protein [Agromyces atrinae]
MSDITQAGTGTEPNPAGFWEQVGAQLDRIESEKPDTFEKLAAILTPITERGMIYGESSYDPEPWVSRVYPNERRVEPDAFPERIVTHGVDYAPRRAFFPGSGGDRSLYSALRVAGWSLVQSEASYYFVAQHAISGKFLTYIEGDVLPGEAR